MLGLGSPPLVSSTEGLLLDVAVMEWGVSLAGATPDTDVAAVAPVVVAAMLRVLLVLRELDDRWRRAEVGVGIW